MRKGQSFMTFAEVGSVRTGKHSGGIKQRHVLTDQGRRMILERYDSRQETTTEMCRLLGVPRWRLHRWAIDLGMTRPGRRAPNWTEADDAYVEQHMPHMSIADIAKHLGRTQTAIRIRAKRYIGVNKTGSDYTMRRLCACLGCDHHKVEFWMAQGWLKGSRRHSDNAKRDPWLFTNPQIRQLIIDHPQEIDPRRADWLWLVDLLAGGKIGIGAL